jgi:hypothetical protein
MRNRAESFALARFSRPWLRRPPRAGGPGPHPGGGLGHHRIVSAAAVALATMLCAALPSGCDGGGATCEGYCDNAIDRVVVPSLRELGLQPREVDEFEICRRISIDFRGRGPSGEEIEECIAASPIERVALAQASPAYLRTTRREWAEVLGYDALETWTPDLLDLDAVAGRIAAGELDYAAFATAVVAHPGFVSLHPEDAWADAVYRVFLGRPARADEVAALRPLSRAFQARYLCEGAIWWNLYQSYLYDGETNAIAVEYADLDCADLAKTNVGFNPCNCYPDDGSIGCATPALGVPVVIPASCVDADDPYASENVLRIGAAEPSTSDECPDGSHHPKCKDREVDEDDFVTMRAPAVWAPVDAAGRASLDAIGAALAARADFWEAAADRLLRRFTGWWQTSFRHPDSDLPEVRAVVAGLLRDGTSLAELERILATSQLYAAPASAPPGWGDRDGDPPPWTMGPTKLLAAEPWLDTVLLAAGETPGACDFRYVTVYGFEYELGDPRYAEEPYSSLDGIFEDYYVDAAQALGGCMARKPRPSESSVGLAFAQGEHARTACAYGGSVTRDDWDGDFAGVADRLIRRLYARPPADGELDELVADMEACVAAGACVDPDAAARWMCQRLADSTEFATY